MAILPPPPKPFQMAPEGSHRAVCIGVYDLGTQPSQKFSPSRQLCIVFELADEFMEDGQPFTVSNDYAFYLSGKAKLRDVVESLLNRKFATDAELKNFDVARILGRACLVQVVHNEAKSGKVYANVDATMPLPKGTAVPAPTCELREFSFTEGDTPNWMPKWTADKVRKCLEWAEQVPDDPAPAPRAQQPAGRATSPAARPPASNFGAGVTAPIPGDEDEDLPF